MSHMRLGSIFRDAELICNVIHLVAGCPKRKHIELALG